MLDDEKSDAIVSVVDVPHEYLPMKLMQMNEDGSLKFYQADGEKYTTRQALPHLYARNGAAVYAVYTDVYKETGSLYGTHCLPYEMSPEDSIDIDTKFDLFLAEAVLKGRN
jgi:CMP-N-acetylneuraminic acid synthetase